MATMTIRATYALDAESVRILEQLARRWQVSKSEALRRAIRLAAGHQPLRDNQALDALERLQQTLRLTPPRARAWARAVRAERQSTPTPTAARGR